MNLGQIFANAIARRVAFVVVAAALSWCGMGKASAQDYPQCNDVTVQVAMCADKAQAYSALMARLNAEKAKYTATPPQVISICNVVAEPAQWSGRVSRENPTNNATCANGYATVLSQAARQWAKVCPTGTNWDEATKTCTTDCGSDGWPDPTQPGQCLNEQKCRARNNDNFDVNAPRLGNAASSCVGGCDLSFDMSRASKVVVAGKTIIQGPMSYPGTNASCPTSGTPDVLEPPSTEEKQKCETAGAGQTMCVKRETGEHCATASTGKQICWKPGETGEKTSADVLQKRNAGDQPIPPNLNIPNGDQLQQKGQPITTVTTVNNTTTITTTITNYQTVNGTDANAGTGGDAGQPDDGTGGGGGDDDEGDPNGATGGSCASGYQTTGDPLLGAILKEEHAQRCAGEKRDADNRADAAALDAATPADGDPASIWSNGQAPTFNEGWLVLGSGACPMFSVDLPSGQTFTLPAQFCALGAALAAMFQLVAYLWALRIVSE